VKDKTVDQYQQMLLVIKSDIEKYIRKHYEKSRVKNYLVHLEYQNTT
jgi:hypothetical protein